MFAALFKKIGSTLRSPLVVVAAFLVALTVLLTWPQGLYLGAKVANHGDPFLSMWRLQWLEHALTGGAKHLFDGNIFYPHARTLAYSDATLIQGVPRRSVARGGGEPRSRLQHPAARRHCLVRCWDVRAGQASDRQHRRGAGVGRGVHARAVSGRALHAPGTPVDDLDAADLVGGPQELREGIDSLMASWLARFCPCRCSRPCTTARSSG